MLRCAPILVLLLAGAAAAATVEIPLPGLAGSYDAGLVPPDAAPDSLVVEFSIPPEVTVLHGLDLRLSGTAAPGREICLHDVGGQTVADTLDVVPSMRLILRAPALAGGCYFASVALPDPVFAGATAWFTDCDPGQPLDPDLLRGQTVQAVLKCIFAGSCDPYADPVAELSEVLLVLDAETVPAAGPGWGAVKALYR